MRVDLAKRHGNLVIAVMLIIVVLALTIATTVFVVNKADKDTGLKSPDGGNVDNASTITAEPYNDVVTDAGKLSKGQGSEAYIATLPNGWEKISTDAELKAWLLSNATSGKSAYLAANIPNFAWDGVGGVNAGWTDNDETNKTIPQIASGNILDGAGYAITLSQELADGSKIGKYTSKFTGAISGTMRNIQFTATNYFSTHMVGNAYSRFSGLVAGRLYGTIDNCKFILAGTLRSTANNESDPGSRVTNVLTNYSGGVVGVSVGTISNSTFVLEQSGALTSHSEGWYRPTFGSWQGKGRAFMGVMIGKMEGGSVINNTIINNGGSIKCESNGGDKHLGAISGTFETSTTYTISGLVMKGFTFASQTLSGNNAGVWGTIVGWFSTGTVNAYGIFYISSQQPLYMSAHNDKNNKNRYMDIQYISDNDIDVYFDKSADRADKYIITKKGLGTGGNIYWGLKQQIYTRLSGADSNSTAGLDITDSPAYSVNDLYTKNIANAIIVDKVRFDQKAHNGHPLSIVTGTELRLDSVDNKTVAYNGGEHDVTPVFKNSNGETVLPTAGSVKSVYNDAGTMPSLPRDTPYIGRIRSAIDPAYAYFNAANRQLARINDSITGRVIITLGETATATDYISGTWANIDQIVDTTIANAASVIASAPTRVGISFDGINITEYQDWTDVNRYKAIMNKNTAGSEAYRFALFVGAQQVTSLSADSFSIKFDNITPTMSLHDTHSVGGVRDLSQVFTSAEIMADGNALPELWFSGNAGASGLIMQVRASRNGGEYSEWQQIPDGERPLINGMPANNIFRQRFYFDSEREANGRTNQETFGGTWEFELKVTNGAGIAAIGGNEDGVIKLTIKVNYNTEYTLDSAITMEDGSDSAGVVVFTPVADNYGVGDYAGYNVTINNVEGSDKNYYIKSIGGIAVDESKQYSYDGTVYIDGSSMSNMQTVDVVVGYKYNSYAVTINNIYGVYQAELEGIVTASITPEMARYAVNDSLTLDIAINNNIKGYEYYIATVNGVAVDAATYNGALILGSEIVLTAEMLASGSVSIDITYGRRVVDVLTVTTSVKMGDGSDKTNDDKLSVTIDPIKTKYAIGDVLDANAIVTNIEGAARQYYLVSINGIAITTENEMNGSISITVTAEMLAADTMNIEVVYAERLLDVVTITTSNKLADDSTPLDGLVTIAVDPIKTKYAIGDNVTVRVTVANNADDTVEYYIVSINGVAIDAVSEMDGSTVVTITEDMATSGMHNIEIVYGSRAHNVEPPVEPPVEPEV